MSVLAVVAALASLALTLPRNAPEPVDRELCERALAPAAGTAAEWLRRAQRAVGVPAAGGPLLHLRSRTARELRDQSDRTYPPYITAISASERWVDPATGVERIETEGSPVAILAGPSAAFVARDSAPAAPSDRTHAHLMSERYLDPWLALADWAGSPDVAVAGVCPVRGYPRVVLRRPGEIGPERLFLDRATALPVALARDERHYFLGPEFVAYLYMTWLDVGGGGLYPMAAARIVDGFRETSRTVLPGAAELAPRADGPSLALPDTDLVQSTDPARRFAAGAPDTVRIGADAFLLASPAFTNVVALERDTVFLMDAPAGEERAREDADWIRRLFPGDHPAVLVALNPTWPHVAGLRWWVAHGAIIVSHDLSRPFLERALRRDWSRAPDLLARTSPRPGLRFRGVADSLSLAGGAILLHEIDGTSGEGTLLAYLRGDRFLWSSDHIQSLEHPSIYERQVVETARRIGLEPRWTSGPHFRLEPWSRLTRAVRD